MQDFKMTITDGVIYDLSTISQMINRTVGSPQIRCSVEDYNKLKEIGTHELILDQVDGDAIYVCPLTVEVKESKKNEVLVLWDVFRDEETLLFHTIYIPEATTVEEIEEETWNHFNELWGNDVELRFDVNKKRLYISADKPSIFF